MNQRSAILSQQFPLAIRIKTEMAVMSMNQQVALNQKPVDTKEEETEDTMTTQAKNEWRKKKD